MPGVSATSEEEEEDRVPYSGSSTRRSRQWGIDKYDPLKDNGEIMFYCVNLYKT
jgi:hypothetical protein